MKTKITVTLALGLCLAIAAAASADVVGGQTYEFVNVTAVGAAADFRMGKFEVTEDQWTSLMGGGGSGLTPKVNITFHQAVGFVNAMNAAAGSTAAYNVVDGVVTAWGSGVYRDPDARYFMIDEKEFSDAYHNGSAYQDYATPSGALPTNAEANYQGGSGALWDVGSGAGELNGTYDLMGNAAEFMENDTNWLYPAGAGTNHRFMGGAFGFGSYLLPHTFTYAYGAGGAANFIGFRLGSLANEDIPLGDVDENGTIDGDDIDLMGDYIRTGIAPTAGRYDLSADGTSAGTNGTIDLLDLDYLIHFLVETSAVDGSGDPIFGTQYGDFNLDGEIELGDLTRLGTYYGVGDTWAEGNANRYLDLDIELGDLTILGTYYGASNGGDAIPEPMTLSIMVCGAIGLIRRRRRA